MDSIRVTAKTVEDAITEASIQLGTNIDNIEYTVIDKGSSGFFGIGGRKAVIEAKKKFTDEDLMKEVFGTGEEAKKEVKKEQKREPRKDSRREGRKEFSEKKKENPEKKKEAKKEVKKEEVKKEEPRKEENKKETKKENLSKTSEKTPGEKVNPEENQEPVQEKAAKAPRVPADPQEVKRRAEVFLTDVMKAMGMNVEIKTDFAEDVLSVELCGDDMGLLIGKRGQTLDSLQYLTSLVVNKGKASYVRVKLDTEDYRNRRKATLENLAKNIAFKVKKTRRPVFLEPMNPYERRIIHSALQNDPYVTTHSEGEEPYRKVVVTLKKRQ